MIIKNLICIKLRDITVMHHRLPSTDFQVFGPPRNRRKNPTLQALATSFINNIQCQHPHDYFLWSDGAYSRSKPFASGKRVKVTEFLDKQVVVLQIKKFLQVSMYLIEPVLVH